MKLFSFVVVMGILRLGPLYLTNNFIFLCLLKQLFSLCLINSCGNASFVRFPFLGCVCITGCFLDPSIVAWKCCFLPDSCIPESNYDLLSCCSSFLLCGRTEKGPYTVRIPLVIVVLSSLSFRVVRDWLQCSGSITFVLLSSL